MDDAVRVRRVERRRGLCEPGERAAGRLRALVREPVGERAAGEVLHHDVRAPLVLADVEDRDRVRRVREPRRRQRLAREAPADRLVVRVVLGQHLDRDVAAELGVLGAVDLAHAAARDPLGLPVRVGKVALVHTTACPAAACRKRMGERRMT